MKVYVTADISGARTVNLLLCFPRMIKCSSVCRVRGRRAATVRKTGRGTSEFHAKTWRRKTPPSSGYLSKSHSLSSYEVSLVIEDFVDAIMCVFLCVLQ